MANPYPIYASDLSLWKCSRALYNCAVNRHRKPELDDETKDRLDYYASLETVVMHNLKVKHGWNVIIPERFEAGKRIPKDAQPLYIYKDGDGNDAVRGRIDMVASLPGVEEGGLYEIKTASPYIFKDINSIEDFIDSRHWWIPGQLAQWCLYMYMSGKNYGGIVTADRDSFVINDGVLSINTKVHHASILKGHEYYNKRVADFMHAVMDKIDHAWMCALTGLNPEYCNDLSVCANCWCKQAGVCSPPIKGEGIELGFLGTHRPDDIARMLELEPLAKEYNSLKRKIEEPLKLFVKDHGAPGQGWVVGEGRYLATAKTSERTSYAIPQDIKKEYATKTTAVSISIECLEGGDTND